TSQERKRLTGATINFTSPVDDSGQMLQMMIAGDKLPDVVTIQADSDNVVKLAKEGYVWPLDTLAEHWAPTLNDRVEEDIRAYFEMGDGHLYCLPGNAYSDKYIDEDTKFDSNGGLLVRKDWYEWYIAQPNAKDITKPSGLKDAMARVKEQFTGTGAGKVETFTGMLLDQFTGTGNVSTIYLSQYFGAPFEDAEGNYQDVMETAQYKEMLAWLNELYRDSLIRPSNLTAQMDGIGGVISRGEAFVTSVAPQNYYYSYVNAYRNGVEYVPLILTNEAGETPVIQDLTGNGFLVTMISKKAKNIDQIIKLLDFIYSEEGNRLLMFGKEGDMWNWADEEHTQVQYTEKYLNAKKNQELSKYGCNCLTVMMNLAYLDPITSHEGDLEERLYFDNLKRPIRPYCYSYKISWPKLDPSHKDYVDIIRVKTKMDARWGEYLPDIIKSNSAEKSVSQYTATIEAMNRAGRERYLEFYSRSYTENKQKMSVTWGWPKNDPAFKAPTLRNADGTFSNDPIPATGDTYYLLAMN
ncbi:MAG: extracellular solute-binding protein, partial [Clostridiales bacterium]|nr:extracellular solute-binding protein [Clostridiales bacterium]